MTQKTTQRHPTDEAMAAIFRDDAVRAARRAHQLDRRDRRADSQPVSENRYRVRRALAGLAVVGVLGAGYLHLLGNRIKGPEVPVLNEGDPGTERYIAHNGDTFDSVADAHVDGDYRGVSIALSRQKYGKDGVMELGEPYTVPTTVPPEAEADN